MRDPIVRIEKIDFYFFSGTGNTLLVVKKMRDVFETCGVSVNLYHLDKTDPKKIDLDCVIGLGFPVAEQGTYPFVWDFARSLRKADETPIFMVDTLLAYSGGIVGPMRRIVKEKGYLPIGAKEIMMPNNLFPRKIRSDKNERTINKGLLKAEKYANDILEGRSKWVRVPILSDLMGIFSQKEWTWKLFRKYYNLKVDTLICKKCGLCAKLCPIDDIVMKEYPEHQGTCVFCMRCISFCPTRAMHRSRGNTNYQVYQAVKASELLKN